MDQQNGLGKTQSNNSDRNSTHKGNTISLCLSCPCFSCPCFSRAGCRDLKLQLICKFRFHLLSLSWEPCRGGQGAERWESLSAREGQEKDTGCSHNPRDPVPPALGVLHTLAWQGAPHGAAAGAAPAWKCLDAVAPETITSMGMIPPCLKTQEKGEKREKSSWASSELLLPAQSQP